jgi:murein DD-endopeptidase MepM/ murein hydrolase activator NlpD
MTAYFWNDKANRYQGTDGKFVNPGNMPDGAELFGSSAPAAPPQPQAGISQDTALLLKVLTSIDKKLEKANKQSKKASDNQSDLSIGIELTIQWLLAFLMFCYPTLVRLVQDPIGTITGTNLGAEIYSKEIKDGDTIGGFKITSGFGDRNAPKDGASTNHEGVDLGTPIGVQLYMIGTAKGKVECAEQPDGGGTYATITPVGIPYTFKAMHLSQCAAGEYDPGQAIAATGNSGNSTGEHLHWGMFKDGQAINTTEGFLLWALKGTPPSPVTDTAKTGLSSATDLYSRIIKQESGGDPTQINPDTGAIGIGQVMPENVLSWTKEALGTEMTADQFAADADAQKKVVDFKLNQYTESAKAAGNSGVDLCRQVAADWYGGEGADKDSMAPQAGYPSIKAYTESVCAGYGGKP